MEVSVSGIHAEIGTVNVGAINSSGTFASFSSRESNLLVTAPGSGITYDYDEDSGATKAGSGTSFSAPIV